MFMHRRHFLLPILCLLLCGCDSSEQAISPPGDVPDRSEPAPMNVVAVSKPASIQAPRDSEARPATNPPAKEPVFTRTFYVSPKGQGSKDGSDWANAVAAKSLPVFLSEEVKLGNRVLLGSGKYERFSLSQSGAADQPITIQGVDTGDGPPLIQGRWKETNPKYHAHSWSAIKLADGVSHVRIGGLQINGFIYGVQAANNADIELFDLAVSRCRECISVTGLTNSTIKNCQLIRYAKRGIRFKAGCHDLVIANVIADATGGDEAWPTEAFPFGFAVEKGDGNHSIRYEHCTAKNNIFPGEKGSYWNGDGFIAENNSKNLTYVDCMSFGNTDGGWDDKSLAPHFENCVAARNKRGFRIWNVRGNLEHPARLVNCLSVFNKSAGGSGSSAGLWTSGAVVAERCTFHNNASAAIAIENNNAGGKVKAIDCILSTDAEAGDKKLVLKEGGTKYEAEGVIASAAGKPDKEPQYKSPSPTWAGDPRDAFNSQQYGNSKGYRSEPAGE